MKANFVQCTTNSCPMDRLDNWCFQFRLLVYWEKPSLPWDGTSALKSGWMSAMDTWEVIISDRGSGFELHHPDGGASLSVDMWVRILFPIWLERSRNFLIKASTPLYISGPCIAAWYSIHLSEQSHVLKTKVCKTVCIWKLFYTLLRFFLCNSNHALVFLHSVLLLSDMSVLVWCFILLMFPQSNGRREKYTV